MLNKEELANRLMRRLCAFPSFHPSKNPDTAEAYTTAIAAMLREFGSERTYEAIAAVVANGGQFPPSAGDLKKFIRPGLEKEIVVGQSSAATYDELDRENSRLKELLTYYGDHQCNCGMPIGEPPCKCGWSKVLAALLGEEDAATVEAFSADLASEIAFGTAKVLTGEPEATA